MRLGLTKTGHRARRIMIRALWEVPDSILDPELRQTTALNIEIDCSLTSKVKVTCHLASQGSGAERKPLSSYGL